MTRHLKLVADGTTSNPDVMTTSVGDDPIPAVPTLPGAAGTLFDDQTELAISMMTTALDALETAMFGGPVRAVGRR